MAKVSLNKLATIKTLDEKTVTIAGQDVLVAQYLPISKKADIIQHVIDGSFDDNGEYSILRFKVLFAVEVVRAYSNINITDKMLEEITKTYDLLVINHILDNVIAAIPSQEYQDLYEMAQTAIMNVNQTAHSALGVLRTIATDYDTETMNVDKLLSNLQDVANTELVQDVLQKLG